MTGERPADRDTFDIPGVVSLTWDAKSQSVLVVWSGRATAQEFSALLDAELRALRAHSSSHLLADLKRQPPIAPDALDGADREWLPRALAAGLRRFAVVLPDDREAAINIEDRLGRVSRDELEVGFFHTIDEARGWLTG